MMVARFGEDRSSHNAALLLLQVRMIAIDEVRDESPFPEAESSYSSLLSVSENDQQSFSDPFDAPVPTTEQKVITPQKFRCRTVSLCSQEEFRRNSPSPALASPESVLVEPDSPSRSRNSSPASSSGSERFLSKNARKSSLSVPLPFNPSHKFVCEVVEGPVKATLKKKFSWKSYPELEAYLIDNRSQYMQYSSQLNYTAEQKKCKCRTICHSLRLIDPPRCLNFWSDSLCR